MELTKKQNQIVDKIHEFVKKECIGFAEDDVFTNHIIGVRDFAIKLAKEYKADLFVVEVAAYLHDIYHIQTHHHEIHEIEGSKFSREYLKQFDIPQDQIELIAKCILNHRGSKDRKRESIEERIIACADAMDHISRFMHMFYRESRNGSYEDLIKKMRNKIKRGWNKIDLEKGRELVKAKYEAAKLLFGIK